MKEKALEVLKSVFGYDEFRPLQWDIIENIVNRLDTLALMPTGGGKSLCFQIPALMMEGTAVVVSPLIALMKDQVEGLVSNGVKADFLNSSQTSQEQALVLEALQAGEIKLLYISPEKLISSSFYPLLQTIKISLIAIDEAHCISAWGHDFRPEYAQIGQMRTMFKGVPVIALTATADKLTRKDIVSRLHLVDPEVYISSFDRPNLSLTVLPGKKRFELIVDFLLARQNESGIIYCLSRKSTENLAAKLRAQGFSAVAYHAGMSNEERQKSQEDFINDEIKIVCATVAFGMGIDKSNVRFVIHYNLPKNIESYYQEIGRAGRDGLPSDTLLFYSYSDVIQLKQFVESSGQKEFQEAKLRRMQDFTEARICRRKVLLAYFGEIKSEDCGNCDVCKNPPKLFDGTKATQMALSAIARLKQGEPLGVVIEVLKGSSRVEVFEKGYHNLKTYGVGNSYSFKEWQDIMLQLLSLGYYEVAYDDHYKLRLTELSKQVLFENAEVQLVDFKEKAKEVKKEVHQVKKIPKLDEELFELLRLVRSRLAREQGKPPYLIFSDATLKDMASKNPRNQAEMLQVSGVGEHKFKQFGELFMDAIIDFGSRNKKKKGDTYKETLTLLKAGHSIKQIAEMRDMAEATIESHLIHLYKTDKIQYITSFLPTEISTKVEEYIKSHGEVTQLKPIFEHFDGEVSYSQIKLVLEKMEKEKR